jgi:putative endonuclease
MQSPHIQTGQEGERIALAYLQKKGYILLSKNWRFGKIELDLIMRSGETIVFIEVKTRKHNDFGYPEESVSNAKQAKIATAAEAYIAAFKIDNQARFDILAITRVQNNWDIFHIEDAFYPFDI